MGNLFKKTIMAGIGAYSLTKEKVEELADELIKRGELSKAGESKFVKDLLSKAEKSGRELEKKTEETVNKVLDKMNLPTRKEVNDLKEELRKMREKDAKPKDQF